jgi:hypothetical protein
VNGPREGPALFTRSICSNKSAAKTTIASISGPFPAIHMFKVDRSPVWVKRSMLKNAIFSPKQASPNKPALRKGRAPRKPNKPTIKKINASNTRGATGKAIVLELAVAKFTMVKYPMLTKKRQK